MAKGKSSSGKNYTSKGERKSSMGNRNTDPGQRLLNQLKALKKGRDVVYTTDVLDKNTGKVKMVSTRVSGKDWLKRRAGEKQVAE